MRVQQGKSCESLLVYTDGAPALRFKTDIFANPPLRPRIAAELRAASDKTGGEGGIRTPGDLSATPDFESGALDHSATSPAQESET